MLNKLFFLLGIFLILILFVPKKFLYKIIDKVSNLVKLFFLPKQKTKNYNDFVKKYLYTQANQPITESTLKSGFWNKKKFLYYTDKKYYLFQYPLSKNKNLTYIILYTRKNLY